MTRPILCLVSGMKDCNAVVSSGTQSVGPVSSLDSNQWGRHKWKGKWFNWVVCNFGKLHKPFPYYTKKRLLSLGSPRVVIFHANPRHWQSVRETEASPARRPPGTPSTRPRAPVGGLPTDHQVNRLAFPKNGIKLMILSDRKLSFWCYLKFPFPHSF